jgi:hypothetical protein
MIVPVAINVGPTIVTLILPAVPIGIAIRAMIEFGTAGSARVAGSAGTNSVTVAGAAGSIAFTASRTCGSRAITGPARSIAARQITRAGSTARSGARSHGQSRGSLNASRLILQEVACRIAGNLPAGTAWK